MANGKRNTKKEQQQVQAAARAQDAVKKTSIHDPTHLAYDRNFEDQARHLNPRARIALGLDPYVQL